MLCLLIEKKRVKVIQNIPTVGVVTGLWTFHRNKLKIVGVAIGHITVGVVIWDIYINLG